MTKEADEQQTTKTGPSEHPSLILRELAGKAKSTKQRALLESPVNGKHLDPVGYWLTPPDLMSELQSEFQFNYDACPFPRPPGFDGLNEEWGTRSYANPPFRGSSPTGWARKAAAEAAKGKLVVLAMGVTGISHLDGILPEGVECRLYNVQWLDPDGKSHKRFPTIFFILRGKGECSTT